MKKSKRALAFMMPILLMAGFIPFLGSTAVPGAEAAEMTPHARMGISDSYPASYSMWQDSFLGGNGDLGVMVFGNPLADTVIYNHRQFNIAANINNPTRRFNTVSQTTLDQITQACLNEDWVTANSLANTSVGWQDGGEGSRHPGYEMTINIPQDGDVANYVRTCDYTDGEIAVNWDDNRGTWVRDTFVSRQDNVIVQYLPAPTDGKLDCSIALTTDPGMQLPMKPTVSCTNDGTGYYLNVQMIYPNSGNAGYEGTTRVVAAGGTVSYDGTAKQLNVSGADSLIMLTKINRYNNNSPAEFAKNQLVAPLAALSADYATLLKGQAEMTEIYNRVQLNLNAPAEDRALTDEALLAKQKLQSTPVLALYERMFDSGRYIYLSCSNNTDGVPDLLGMWNGDSSAGWSGYYHLDANLNLQISGAVMGNMLDVMGGYFNLNNAWVPDEQTNAKKLLGCDGVLGAGNTPGFSSGLISAIGGGPTAYYPYQYVTGEMSWLLEPFWEYYEATGDTDFLRTELYPILKQVGIFYESFLKHKDANGKYIFAGSISPENAPPGLKDANGNALPTLSLMNNSSFDIAGAQFGLNMLLQVCDILNVDKDTGEYAKWQELYDNLPPYIINSDGALAEWSWPSLADHNSYQHRHSSGLIGVWPYRDITVDYTPDLAAAASVFLAKKDQGNYENAGHGLLHGALIAASLNNGASVGKKLLTFAKSFYFNGLATGHYPISASGDRGTFCTDAANTVPTIMMSMLMDSIPASDGHLGEVELLPALPDGMSQGSITGLLDRNRITVNELSWDMTNHTVHCVLTSQIDQSIDLVERTGIRNIGATGGTLSNSALGNIARKLTMTANVPVTVDIQVNTTPVLVNISQGKTATASSQDDPARGPAMAVDGDFDTRWASQSSDNQWFMVDLGTSQQIDQIRISWENAYAVGYHIDVSDDGVNWTTIYSTTTGKGVNEVLNVNGMGRYVKFVGTDRATVNGTKYGYSFYEFQVMQNQQPDETTTAPPGYLPGDVDNSGKVDTTDARMVLQSVVNKIQLTDLQFTAADVNGDEKVDTVDARLILQRIVNKIDHFPVEE